MGIVIIIILVIILAVIYNQDPDVKAKKEAAQKQAAEERELADKVIADSSQAAALSEYLVNKQFSNPDSDFIHFLMKPGAFMKMEVNCEDIRFYINGVEDEVYENLSDDEIPLNLNGYKCYYLPFSALGWADLPNYAMASALYEYLHKQLSALPYLDVRDNSIDLNLSNFYGWVQGQRSQW